MYKNLISLSLLLIFGSACTMEQHDASQRGGIEDTLFKLCSNDGSSIEAPCSLLRQSPMLAVMTLHNYREKQQKTITLPEFDFTALQCVVDLLRLKAATSDEEKATRSNDLFTRHDSHSQEEMVLKINDYLQLELEEDVSPTLIRCINQQSEGNVERVKEEIKKRPTSFHPYLAKYHYLLFGDDKQFIFPELDYGFSIEELSAHDKLPDIEKNDSYLQELNLAHRRVTDLTGLDVIPNGHTIQKLRIALCRLTKIPEHCFDQFTELKELHLSNAQLTTLPRQIFANLVQLRMLDLGHNQLTEIPVGCFDNLAQLRKLCLAYNQILAIPVGCFDGLPELRDLDLSHNQISAIPARCFDNLAKLATLILSYNHIHEISEQGFNQLGQLWRLSLDHNHIETMPENCLDMLRQLTSLSLEHNRITTLPEHLLDHLTELRNITLSHNRLTTLPANCFAHPGQLLHLYLDNNQIATIDQQWFENLAELLLLDVSHNQIAAIPRNCFDSLVQLSLLNLRGNNLNNRQCQALYQEWQERIRTINLDYQATRTLWYQQPWILDTLAIIAVLYARCQQINQ